MTVERERLAQQKTLCQYQQPQHQQSGRKYNDIFLSRVTDDEVPPGQLVTGYMNNNTWKGAGKTKKTDVGRIQAVHKLFSDFDF